MNLKFVVFLLKSLKNRSNIPLKISIKNMKRVARELGKNLSEEELQAMIDEFDRDQGGEISSDEFM